MDILDELNSLTLDPNQFKTRAEAQAKLDWIYSNTDWLLNGYIVKNLNEL